MASFTAGTVAVAQTPKHPKPSTTHLTTPKHPKPSTTHLTTPIRCHQISSQNPNTKPSKPLKVPLKTLGVAAAVSGVIFLTGGKNPLFSSAGGGFWRKFFSAAANADEEKGNEWDNHGMPADIVVQLNKLSGFKKYKVSEILFLDKVKLILVGSDDSIFEMVSVRANGVYTKAQLQKELETLATSGMFEKVDFSYICKKS